MGVDQVIAILAGFFGSIVIIDLRQRVVRLENTVLHLAKFHPNGDDPES